MGCPRTVGLLDDPAESCGFDAAGDCGCLGEGFSDNGWGGKESSWRTIEEGGPIEIGAGIKGGLTGGGGGGGGGEGGGGSGSGCA